MSAIRKLIAAARRSIDMDGKLADAAEKELAEPDAYLTGLLKALEERNEARKELALLKAQPRIDLEALRKALLAVGYGTQPEAKSDQEWGEARSFLRSLLAQLQGAKADEERRIVDEMMAQRPKPEVRKAGAKGQPERDPPDASVAALRQHFRELVAPKPEAQTCTLCNGDRVSQNGRFPCPSCNGTGKVGGK